MQVKIVGCIVLIFAGLPGCVMMSTTPHVAEVEKPTAPVQYQSIVMNSDGKPVPVDFTKFEPGVYCKLETTPSEQAPNNDSATTDGKPESVPHPARILAGRIVSIDETNIVLADSISISSNPGRAVAVPATTKAIAYLFYGPFAPRLFKVSGVGRETIAIPGEVTISRDSIRDLQRIDGTNWELTQNSGQWFERIGIDFTF